MKMEKYVGGKWVDCSECISDFDGFYGEIILEEVPFVIYEYTQEERERFWDYVDKESEHLEDPWFGNLDITSSESEEDYFIFDDGVLCTFDELKERAENYIRYYNKQIDLLNEISGH